MPGRPTLEGSTPGLVEAVAVEMRRESMMAADPELHRRSQKKPKAMKTLAIPGAVLLNPLSREKRNK
jgi:hypothetical protein